MDTLKLYKQSEIEIQSQSAGQVSCIYMTIIPCFYWGTYNNVDLFILILKVACYNPYAAVIVFLVSGMWYVYVLVKYL